MLSGSAGARGRPLVVSGRARLVVRPAGPRAAAPARPQFNSIVHVTPGSRREWPINRASARSPDDFIYLPGSGPAAATGHGRRLGARAPPPIYHWAALERPPAASRAPEQLAGDMRRAGRKLAPAPPLGRPAAARASRPQICAPDNRRPRPGARRI